jgi:hypothetical protein
MGTSLINPGTNTINWNGLTTFSDFTGNGNGSPLPISLLNFAVQPVLENVAITWTTASETNNDYFTIERSIDGVNFESLIEVDGAGNSNQALHYKTTDLSPFEGQSYYRLKQTDFDGKFAYSEIRSVDFIHQVGTTNWTLFPNPTSLNGIYINTIEDDDRILSIKLFDLSGKVLHQQTLTINQQTSSYFINFDGISTGIYMLELNDGTMVKTSKIILQNKE